MNNREELTPIEFELCKYFNITDVGTTASYVTKTIKEFAVFLAADRTEQTRLARNALIADVVNILENEKKQWLGDPPALDAINYVIESVGMLAPKPEKGPEHE